MQGRHPVVADGAPQGAAAVGPARGSPAPLPEQRCDNCRRAWTRVASASTPTTAAKRPASSRPTLTWPCASSGARCSARCGLWPWVRPSCSFFRMFLNTRSVCAAPCRGPRGRTRRHTGPRGACLSLSLAWGAGAPLTVAAPRSPRDSQAASTASRQSEPVASRAVMDALLADVLAGAPDNEGPLPLPDQWSGRLAGSLAGVGPGFLIIACRRGRSQGRVPGDAAEHRVLAGAGRPLPRPLPLRPRGRGHGVDDAAADAVRR